MTVQLSASELLEVARLIDDNHPEESGEYEVKYKGMNVVLDYEVEYREGIGGSYEGYQFERIAEVDREHVTVKGVYDSAGDEICGVTKQIQEVLN